MLLNQDNYDQDHERDKFILKGRVVEILSESLLPNDRLHWLLFATTFHGVIPREF
jgi:hypothetical protein